MDIKQKKMNVMQLSNNGNYLPDFLNFQSKFPSFSIVINTLNREVELAKTLDSLQWLKYPGEFEVVVVNGPSTDNSSKMLETWKGRVRVLSCDVANLSVSRNVGICAAQGDIIAFIDDDAIPEPEWLTQLAEAYENPVVGAAGGFVYNHTGFDFQYEYVVVDRFGNADVSVKKATPNRSFPSSLSFPHLLGCNSSFRRSALMEIGGFDEEYEYFLDETDVCLRIVDAGYLIEQLPNAFVHHKYAPSNIRGSNKIVKYRYPIIKNKIYFMLKHARDFYSLKQIIDEQAAFFSQQENEVKWAVDEGLLSKSEMLDFYSDLERAIDDGTRRGLEGPKVDAYITASKIAQYKGDFFPFETLRNGGRSLLLISRSYPPGGSGGIATFNRDLAQALAAEGNTVHVICEGQDLSTVDFEQGVWVHRILPTHQEKTAKAVHLDIPQHIWDWSASALIEARRIETHRSLDVVEAPVWDCEGIAFMLDANWPLVTSLQTTLHFWLQSHPSKRSDKEWMMDFGAKMLLLERQVMTQCQAVRSISAAIRTEIEYAYNIKFEETKLLVAPLGMPEGDADNKKNLVEKNHVTVLFVGRLEHRKGIDVLLRAIPKVLLVQRNIEFRIVGDSSLEIPNSSKTYKEVFCSSKVGKACSKRVTFLNHIDDEALLKEYQDCDVFLAPSRFESFGLVFLEAMRCGKPVIGCNAGGMPEIISDQLTGLLIEPNDVDKLAHSVLRLSTDPELRKTMGAAGQSLFREKFTARKMATSSEYLYDMASNNFQVA